MRKAHPLNRICSFAAVCLAWGPWAQVRAASAASAPPAGEAGARPAQPAASTFRGRELPWPEPETKAVEKLCAELKAQLPQDRFRVLCVGPWVLASDLEEQAFQHFADSTIAVYTAQIQKQLFTFQARREPVKVYLFKDHDSYTAWNVKLFGERPSTPYGYYSRARKALVMNIGTGGGTLLHELVHAMAEADFPQIPAWLNEGLGSLFEASDMDRNRKVIGVTNWRLTGLQESLRKGSATRFTELLKMDDETFYGEGSGAHYASARYLMQYLQEQGRLEAFYTRIRDKKDKDAAVSLLAVFDDKFTLEELEKACYEWVRTLRLR